jgi:uncharacterized protein (AIM24 family)
MKEGMRLVLKNNSEVYSIIDTVKGRSVEFNIVQFKDVTGSNYFGGNMERYYAEKTGMGLNQIQVSLNNGSVITEAGALHYLKGNIQLDNSLGGAKSVMKKLATNMLTNESFSKPKYTGTGEIFLEPSTNHFLLLDIENDQIIVDKGMFYCCESTIEVGVAAQKNFSSAVKGGEGLFQTKLSGTGVIALESPVPPSAVVKVELNNETLQVDGSFAILRTGSIEFTVEKSSKSILGSMTSGEGLLQTFRGTGQVWLTPTIKTII